MNVIAKNILSQFDNKSYIGTLVYSIVYYKIDDSEVEKADKSIFTRIIQHRLRNMTQGWKLLVAWKDGSKTWILLKDRKKSSPVYVADFDKAKGTIDATEVACWLPYTLRNGVSLYP